jgi:hypothetical protein
MADLKISQLTAITTLTPATDVLPVVDVTGTTKKITTNQILGAGGTATLASATITGDLTVDTNTLYVKSSTNQVGIGTTSPNVNFTLDLTSSNDARARQWFADVAFVGTGDLSTGFQIRTLGTGTNGLKIANSANTVEWLRIDSSGNVGVGVTPSIAWNTGSNLQIGVFAALYTNSSLGAVDLTSNSIRTGSDTYQYLSASSNSASRFQQRDGSFRWFNAAAGTSPNAITFGDPKMTLDASGRLLIAKASSATASTGCELQTGAGGNSASVFTADGAFASIMNRLTSDGIVVDLRRQTLSVGNISVTTTGATFNSTSDYRLKESVAPLSGGLSRVNALKPSVYKWKSNGSDGEGFLAHELAEVVPAAVNGDKDAVNEDGTIKAQSIDMSRIVPILVAAIQELTARVQTLEAR